MAVKQKNTGLRLGAEYSKGLGHRIAIDALKKKIVLNAQGANWRTPESYVQGLYDAHLAVEGIERLHRLKEESRIPEYLREKRSTE